MAEIGEDQRSRSAHDRVYIGHNGSGSATAPEASVAG